MLLLGDRLPTKNRNTREAFVHAILVWAGTIVHLEDYTVSSFATRRYQAVDSPVRHEPAARGQGLVGRASVR